MASRDMFRLTYQHRWREVINSSAWRRHQYSKWRRIANDGGNIDDNKWHDNQ